MERMRWVRRRGLAGARRLIPRSYDERRQTRQRLGEAHERMPQQLGRREPPVDVHLKAVVKEVLEDRRQLVPLLDLRLAVRRDQIQRLHGRRATRPRHFQRNRHTFITPHRSTTYVDAAYCYRRSSVVCLSVTIVQMTQPIEMPFVLW